LNKLDFILTSPKSYDDFERYYQFRWQQLRKPLKLPAGSERDPLDKQSFHCMVVAAENSIVAVGSIQPLESNIMRIRYMAVGSEFQRLGIGTDIVKCLLAYAVEHQACKCWLNARSNAVIFYQKQGFELIGEVETELAVPHFKMETSLIG
jgi:predicted GNAT family N-acyltransferase